MDPKDKKEEPKKSLAEAFELYQKGLGQAPEVHFTGKAIKNEDGTMRVILTKELVDLEGEVVEVAGLELPESNSVPFIDAHYVWGSVVQCLLGRVNSLTKSQDEVGVNQVVGLISFANTPNGQQAKTLYEDGTATDVSIGFIVLDYDSQTRRIRQGKLFECSAVLVGANQYAKVQKAISMDKTTEEIDIKLANYDDIHPKMKLFREKFLNDNFCVSIGYTKTGDELIDIANISDILCVKLMPPESEETPKTPEIDPENQVITVKDAKDMLYSAIFTNRVK